MSAHLLKIYEQFADDVCSGKKTFEIRREDGRRFEVGDRVAFLVVRSQGDLMASHALCDKRYSVSYVLRGWGLEKGYAALAIKEER